MNIIDNLPFGVGYYDPISEGIKEVKELELILFPFERKQYSFYIYGTDITENSLLSIIASLETLIPASEVKVSLSADKGTPNYWTNTDTIHATVAQIYQVKVDIHNKYYTELNCNLRLDVSLYKNEKVTELSYYGPLNLDGTLAKEIEVKSQRTIVIDPVVPGADYTYLSYSNGDSLIYLDNDTAIPYKELDPITIEAMNSVAMPEGGYLMWDDGEFVDWD